MAEKTRACPKCNGIMEFRLGEFICNQCSHSELIKPVATEVRAASGPGFKKTKQWTQPDSGLHQGSGFPASPPPPPSTLYNPGQAQQFQGGADHGKQGPKQVQTHEMVIWGCLAFFLPIVGVIVAAIWGKQNRSGAESCAGYALAWWGLNVLIIILGFIFGGQG